MTILSVNRSKEAGRKFPAERLDIRKDSILNDYNGESLKHITLLDWSYVDRFRKLTGGHEFEYGEFGEHITLEGVDINALKIFDLFKVGDAILEVMKIGYPVNGKIAETVSDYLMPRSGIYCRVLKEGTLRKGMQIEYEPKVFKMKVITLSDRASKGIYQDISGPAITDTAINYFKKLNWRLETENVIMPDNPFELKETLQRFIEEKADIIFTTGGTGIGPKDFTMGVVKPILTKEIPGIMEMIRLKYGSEKPNALLSAGVAGVVGNTLIYTLPGSVKAVKEYTNEIFKTLQHLIYMLYNIDVH
ncbi:MAG: hypothetical protein JEZ03_04130 [Bacteroidales bacterium]|nr:hypothetical protein [Bacteroidales bacterium]